MHFSKQSLFVPLSNHLLLIFKIVCRNLTNSCTNLQQQSERIHFLSEDFQDLVLLQMVKYEQQTPAETKRTVFVITLRSSSLIFKKTLSHQSILHFFVVTIFLFFSNSKIRLISMETIDQTTCHVLQVQKVKMKIIPKFIERTVPSLGI